MVEFACRQIAPCAGDNGRLGDRPHVFAQNVSRRHSLVRSVGLRERIGAVTDTPRPEKRPDLRQLRTAQTDLCCRNGNAEVGRGAGKTEREVREQRSVALQRLQEAACRRAADGVDDEINVLRLVLGSGHGVADEDVDAEVPEERLVPARRHSDHARARQLCDLNRKVSNPAIGVVDKNGPSIKLHRLMPARLELIRLVVPEIHEVLQDGE